MKNITATYKNDEVTFLEEKTSAEIGKIIYEKNKEPRLILDKEEYSIVRTSKNEIEILKNDEKIEFLSRDKIGGNYQFKNSVYQIKGISSWKGGTKLVDETDNIIASIQNKNAFFDKGIYSIQLQDNVVSLFILLSLHIHIETSKYKTTTAVLFVTILCGILTELFIFSNKI